MRLHRSLTPLVVTAAVLLSPACFPDAVLDWNDIALAQISATGQAPPDGARTMAMVHVAIFDAANAIDRRYTPYAFKGDAPAGSSAEAAIAAAAHAVLTNLFPGQKQQTDVAYATALARVPDGQSKTAGIALGKQVGAECFSMRAKDGTGAPNTYRPRTQPGKYVPTSLPVSMEWPNVKPWFIRDGAQFRPAPAPDLKSATWTRDYNEIESLGARRSATRTPAQTEVGRFWTIVGPASWNPVVRSLAQSGRSRLVDNARLFALVNMAASDAFVAVFDAKYAYDFWRPITAIRNGDLDGNDATAPNPEWLPLIETPMHPEYPCAHCITASAIGTVLQSQFGDGEVSPITMTSATAPGVTHRWTRIADYVAEVNNARVWSGVHYRNSTQVGEAMGKAIGAMAVRQVLTPIGSTVR